jgi:hypothetical protein
MRVLVGSSRLGPAAVFLPDGTHAAVPASENLIEPLIAQVQARGPQATFEEHAERLVQGPPYAGHWSLLDVPDGISAPQALHYARYRVAADLFRDKG